MRLSQITTLIIGSLTLIIASSFRTVLEIILHAYSFMVAGLFIPTLGAYFWRKSHPTAAFVSMIIGGGSTLFLIFSDLNLPFGLDASFYGILISLILFIGISLLKYNNKNKVQQDL
jgi:SSS family solute:Na+ symporter